MNLRPNESNWNLQMNEIRIVAIVTLAFLGITACMGAIPLILDPSGKLLMMPLRLLEHSPFRSYLIPGLILLAGNGLLSALVLMLALRRTNGYGWWIVLQGCVITGWIAVQVLMIRVVIWAHFVYLAIGLVLVLCGWLLRNESLRKRRDSRTD